MPLIHHERITRLFKSHQRWLRHILRRGSARGEFKLAESAAKTARLVFGALQGALLVQRTTGDSSQVMDVISALKAELRGVRWPRFRREFRKFTVR